MRQATRKCLLASGAMASGFMVTSLPAAQYFVGEAFARKSGEALYSEAHYLYLDGAEARHLVLYRCLDGKAFARKLLKRSPTSTTPDFDFVDARSGYREGASVEGTQLRVYTQKDAGAALSSKTLPMPAGAVVDAGFDTYLREHWDNIISAPKTMPFALPARLAFMDIRLSASGGDATTQHLQMRLDAWYGALVGPIDLAYSRATHRILRFEGLGNIRRQDGDNQQVRIDFKNEPDRDIPQSDVDAAASETLLSRCAPPTR